VPDPLRRTDTVLDRIVEGVRSRLAETRLAQPESQLSTLAALLPGRQVDFAERLRMGAARTPACARLRLIAEVKRASPSKGVFDETLDAAERARAYAEAGAAAISVLTEPAFFRGSIADLRAARGALGEDAGRPALLRKEFIFDPYQLREARANGADAALLIAMMLAPAALTELVECTRSLGMEPLVEVHDETELGAALDAGALVVGVNNRDLRSFEEDLTTTERLAPLLPSAVTLVAESGIRGAREAGRMAAAGAHAVLVGEALVLAGERELAARARELMLVEGPSQPSPDVDDAGGGHS
jgi:indole-3-glycerol phosphate synthase